MELREVLVKRLDEGGGEMEAKEWVVSEERYQIQVNRKEVALVSASPDMMKELAVGYVVGGGFLTMGDIREVEVGEHTVNVVTERQVEAVVKRVRESECSSHWVSAVTQKEGMVTSRLQVKVSVVLRAVSRLQSDSETWKKTHAVHSAALFRENGDLIGLVEDISRHNAFEKIIGKALLDKIDLSSTFAAVSGRITQDMVFKAGNVGIPVLASRSTVIEPAVAVASALGVTLLGYVRGDHLVVFSHGERVVW